jgi:formylglycine-generating enzyme required for sulfatase activity
MFSRQPKAVLLLVSLVLIAGCGGVEPPPTSLPTVPTADAPAPSPVPPPATPEQASPTATVAVEGEGRGLIAFYSDRDGNPEIYVMNPDGGDQRRLTFDPSEDSSPDLSPDGSQVAFISDRDDPQAGQCFPDCRYQLYMINTDGSEEHRLLETEFRTLHPDWHPDGTKLSFDTESDLSGDIYQVNAGGSGLQRLIEDGFWADWSPDGRQIVFASKRDGNVELYVADADGGSQRRLTESTTLEFFPAWSPDGRRIAYATVEQKQIFVMDAHGAEPGSGNVQQLTFQGDAEGPSWSPDGTQIVFQSSRDGDFEIYALDVDDALQSREGAVPRRLTENRAGDLWPSWGRAPGGAGSAAYAPVAGASPAPPSLGEPWIRPADGMVMVPVPGGRFVMGSAEDDPEATPDELPQHTVTVDGFWIDQVEVTNAQFVQFLNEQGNGSGRGSQMIILDQGYTQISQMGDQFVTKEVAGERPVVMVTWQGAAAYCTWAGGRLPTEAEWEYAARGSEGNRYPWGNAPPTCDLANHGRCSGVPVEASRHPAGASWCGALDMAGNVWEWVADWFGPYSGSPQENPTGPAAGDVHVLRGGGWHSPGPEIRTTCRLHDIPAGGSNG